MPRSNKVESILSRPYAERQLIVVAKDDFVKASREAENAVLKAKNNSRDDQKGINWVAIGDTALKIALGGTAGLALEITKEAVNAWSRARANGVDVFQISASEADSLKFPPGHPRAGILYIGHPALPDVYYTMADFHRVTFEHKCAEAVSLLMHLGATKISVEHVTGWAKDFTSRISVPLGAAGKRIQAKGSSKTEKKSELLYNATFPGNAEPKKPSNMVWYPHEATWQTIADGRIEFGLAEFSLSIAYEDDYGVNAGLKASVLKAGLEIGGSFEDHQSTVWRMEGEFATQN